MLRALIFASSSFRVVESVGMLCSPGELPGTPPSGERNAHRDEPMLRGKDPVLVLMDALT